MSKSVFLNLEQRIEVLRQYENGKSTRKLAELFNCGKTQINRVIKEKDLIFKEDKDFKFCGVKRMRHEKYVDIYEAVLEWFITVRAKKFLPVDLRFNTRQKNLRIIWELKIYPTAIGC
ncbi:hypothetical protein AVEN_128997-1 [Araneus ventricosus]|uniref:HTH psq-type domain-containing protein n=1 Tax=Araneus ventricosus TaxID=182803 RepID=A0A4Y2GCC5_ARAVE|nr:hypothetical protein AVEN_128997-1 [Araneus ventricosus]